jgi:hypothetical protein
MNRELETDCDTGIPDARRIVAQVAGVVVPPLAVLAGMEVSYGLVGPACASGGSVALHLTRIVTLLIVLGAGGLAWREWRRVGVERPGDGGSVGARTRFLSWVGVFASVLFALVVVAQWLAAFILTPCQ